MTRYPIGIQTFDEIRDQHYLYVDKTDLVYKLAKNFTYVFLARPRRFGKSLLVSTLEAYFSGCKDLFKGLAIEHLEKAWNAYPVLHFSMASAKRGTVEDLDAQLHRQLALAEDNFALPDGSDQDVTVRFQNLVARAFQKTGLKAVVLIDEYDAPLYPLRSGEKKLQLLRTELDSFYSALKDLEPYLQFVFITGITKASQLSIFSELNSLESVSLSPDFAALCGFTQQELEQNFSEGIKNLGRKYGLDRSQALQRLKEKYFGYRFSKSEEGVYNPVSLLSAMKNVKTASYWFETGTPALLADEVLKARADITKLEGCEVKLPNLGVPTE